MIIKNYLNKYQMEELNRGMEKNKLLSQRNFLEGDKISKDSNF